MKHKHLFKKYSEGNVVRNQKEVMEQMFGKLPPLPKCKKWGNEINWETVFKCKCGETQRMIDIPGGEYNKNLPEEFTI